MQKLYRQVSENPELINQFQYSLPTKADVVKFAQGGSNYRNKIMDYLYEDDEKENSSVITQTNTAPTEEEIQENPISQPYDSNDEMLAYAMSQSEEPPQYINPYKEAINKYTGKSSSSNKGFQSFSSPEEGRAALINQLSLYQTGRTKNPVKPDSTLYEAMSVYAPASDGNNPKHYAEFVAKQIGVSPDTAIKNIDLNRWADAVTKMEGNTKGNNPGNIRPYKRK